MRWTSLLLLPALLSGTALVASNGEDAHSALEACLTLKTWDDTPVASDLSIIPLGLIEGQHVVVTPLARGRAYALKWVSGRVSSCGIAIYGPVSQKTERDLRRLVESYDGKPAKEVMVSTAGIAPAEKLYWGPSGLAGVMMLTRPQSTMAPTVEIERHVFLVP